MDIFWGVVALLLVVGTTVAALAVRREDPSRPWFPAGSDGAFPSWSDAAVDRPGGDSAGRDRDAERAVADLRAAGSWRDDRPAAHVDAHEVAAELVLRRVVPDRAVRDGVRGAPHAPAGAPVPADRGRDVRQQRAVHAPSSTRRVPLGR